MARIDTATEFVLFCRPSDHAELCELCSNFRPVTERAGAYSMREQIAVPLDLSSKLIDLYHDPHYVLPPLVPCKSVVTIHDCIHLRFPQYLPNKFAHAYARTSLWFAAHRSNRILTVSEASKRDIL